MFLAFAALSIALWTGLSRAAFGIVESGNSYTIDAGSSNALIFSVDRSSCDITSILYRGTELQSPAKGSHIGSGLGQASVSATQDGSCIVTGLRVMRRAAYIP